MFVAFRAVRRNRGAAGIDKVSVAMFEANLEQNLAALMRDLKQGTLVPKPLRRAYIDKGKGQFRPLGIPAVRDRVAQEVLRRLLSPLFERRFHDDSYGFRPGRNCHQAVERVLELHRLGHLHVLDADIKGFFDNIPHAVIMAGLSAVVADGNILRLVEKFLKSGVMESGVWSPTRVGTPQGGVISPLLANIALDSLDWYLHERGYRFVRYADDFVVLCQEEHQAQEALDCVAQQLARLGLTLSAEKTTVTTFAKGFTFLGFAIGHQSVIMRDKSVEKFKTNVREVTRRSHNLDAEVAVKLNRIVRGVANYFVTPFSRCADLFRRLDRWLRMRLRCMRFKCKSRSHNQRMRLVHLRHRGFLYLSDFLLAT
jgi:group II intron reverse transcriptase/maturase